MSGAPISLVSRWFPKAGHVDELRGALIALAERVRAQESGTLTYLVHVPASGDPRLLSLPPADGPAILFFETYADADAFEAHLNGTAFTEFVAQHGDHFVGAGGKPYTTVMFLECVAGFAAPVGGPRRDARAAAAVTTNRHPAVMFELIARHQKPLLDFYRTVFGWQYQIGTGDFAYVHFPAGSPALLGGIGQADPSIPGFEPGHNFYLLVDRIEPVLDAVGAAGGSLLMPPTAIDGYRFAMFRDPESNPVGLIEPFAD
jgi:predicted enzyme related to lactoylglutathione lyase/quinol monooxygenase YgiN